MIWRPVPGNHLLPLWCHTSVLCSPVKNQRTSSRFGVRSAARCFKIPHFGYILGPGKPSGPPEGGPVSCQELQNSSFQILCHWPAGVEPPPGSIWCLYGVIPVLRHPRSKMKAPPCVSLSDGPKDAKKYSVFTFFLLLVRLLATC